MTDTLDTWLSEANNMGRAVNTTRRLAAYANDARTATENLHNRMKALAERQAAYMRAIDSDDISSATITFNIKKDGVAVPGIGITNANTIRDMLVGQAKSHNETLARFHDTLLRIEEIANEMELTLRNYADTIKTLANGVDERSQGA